MGKAWKIQFTCLPTMDPSKRIQPSAFAMRLIMLVFLPMWRYCPSACFILPKSTLLCSVEFRLTQWRLFDWSHCSICRPSCESFLFLWSQPGLDPMAARKTRSMEERKEEGGASAFWIVFIKLGKTVWRRLWKIFVSGRSKRMI